MTTPSGPGQFSERTDKAVYNANQTLPDAQYGENRDYQEMKSASPMANSPEPGGMNLAQLLQGMSPDVVPMGAETAMPDVPVTDGAALGPGAGPEAIASSAPPENVDAIKAAMVGVEWMANRPNTSDSARNLIRKFRAQIGY